MKILRERETENHFIFEFRPHELFDLSTSDEFRLHPERMEAALTAVNKATGRRECFASVKHKKMGITTARSFCRPRYHPAYDGDAAALASLLAQA